SASCCDAGSGDRSPGGLRGPAARTRCSYAPCFWCCCCVCCFNSSSELNAIPQTEHFCSGMTAPSKTLSPRDTSSWPGRPRHFRNEDHPRRDRHIGETVSLLFAIRMSHGKQGC